MLHIFNKKFIAGFLSLFLLLFLLVPVLSLAENIYTPLITVGIETTYDIEVGASASNISNPCDFNDFVDTLNRIINWIISIAGVIFTISFIYDGFLWMTSGGDSGKTGKAREILWSTLKGFVIMLCAWLIVYTLLKALVPSDSEYRNSIFKFIGGGSSSGNAH